MPFICYRHGLGRTDFFILNDPELSFREIVRKNMISVKNETSTNALKLERPEDILKLDRNEIVVKLEKGEGTLKIEKIGSTPLKVEIPIEDDSGVKVEKSDSASVKTEPAEGGDSIKTTCDVSVREDGEEKDGLSCERTEVTVSDEPKCDLKSTTSGIEKTDNSKNSQCSPSDEKSESEELKQGTEAQELEKVSNCDTLKRTLEAPPMDIVPQEVDVHEDVQVPKDINLSNVSETSNTENKDLDTHINMLSSDLVKTEGALSDKLKKEMEDEKKNADVKMETGSVKSESDINSVKEETRTDLSGSTDISKTHSSGNTEVVDRFKAMFPELEVMHRFPEIDTTVVADKQSTIAQLLQQSYQNPIKWPKVRHCKIILILC